MKDMKSLYQNPATLLWLTITLSLLSIGCEKKTVQRLEVETVEQPTVRMRPCNVLLIGLDSLAVSMERQWAARHEMPLTVTKIGRAEFVESGMKVASDINVLVYPADMMVELIDNKRIDPLGKDFYDSDAFNKFSLLKHYRKTGIRFDGKPFAAPCGGPMFVQIYRADLLKAAGQTVPTTWEQLIKTQTALSTPPAEDNVAPAEGNVAQAEGEVAQAVALPLAEGWAAQSFLAMSSPYVRQFGRLSVMFDRNTMKPMLESAGFVRALDELKKIAAANPQSLKMDPASVYQALRNGDAAIGLTWPHSIVADGSDGANEADEVDEADDAEEEISIANQSNQSDGAALQKALDQLRVAQVPGTADFYDSNDSQWVRRESGQSVTVNFHNMPGVLVSNARSRGRKQAAEQFIGWLTEPAIGEILFGQENRSGPFRATHLAKIEDWGDPESCSEFRASWSGVLRESHEQALIMTFPKIARSGEYLELLDQGIRKCLQENLSAQDSLAEISQQWESLTESIGRPKQLKLLERNESF